MSKNNSRKDTSQRKTLEGISQEEWLDAHLKGFEKWIQQYKRIVIDKSPHMALGDIQIASDNETQSSQLQEAFLDAWKIIITKVKSPENIEHIRNTLDDLMGDYDFLARKLRRHFGDDYGLGSSKRTERCKRGAYSPHVQFIEQKITEEITDFQTIWRSFRELKDQDSFVIEDEIVRITHRTVNKITYTFSGEHYSVNKVAFRQAVSRARKKN